jgi:hypothetical protein
MANARRARRHRQDAAYTEYPIGRSLKVLVRAHLRTLSSQCRCDSVNG